MAQSSFICYFSKYENYTFLGIQNDAKANLTFKKTLTKAINTIYPQIHYKPIQKYIGEVNAFYYMPRKSSKLKDLPTCNNLRHI